MLEEFVTDAISHIKTNKTITVEGKINSSELYLSLLTSKVIAGIEFNDTLMVLLIFHFTVTHELIISIY